MARLWEEFPRPEFFGSGLNGIHVSNDPAAAGVSFGPTEPALASLFRPTMEWLLAERYITGKSNGAGHFALIVLTQKGFSVLKEIPRSVVHEPSVLQNKSLGALMRAATIEKSVGVVLETLVKAMIGAAMASG